MYVCSDNPTVRLYLYPNAHILSPKALLSERYKVLRCALYIALYAQSQVLHMQWLSLPADSQQLAQGADWFRAESGGWASLWLIPRKRRSFGIPSHLFEARSKAFSERAAVLGKKWKRKTRKLSLRPFVNSGVQTKKWWWCYPLIYFFALDASSPRFSSFCFISFRYIFPTPILDLHVQV